MTREPTRRREFIVLVVVVGAAMVWSGIAPKDRLTWWLEVAPVLLVVPVLIATRHRFPFTALAYRLLCLHALVLIVGAHYTYSEVPAGYWVKEWLDLSRNHYDRLGHLVQGFVPAIVAREVLLRCSPLRPGKWLFVISVAFCLSFSAFYEMLEWWTAVLGKAEAEAFLSTQGDPWDTQWDMFLALTGAIISLLILSPAHDRALARLGH